MPNPNRAGVWTLNIRDLTHSQNGIIQLAYNGVHGVQQFSVAHTELSDLRHVIEQTIKEAIRTLPVDRRIEV